MSIRASLYNCSAELLTSSGDCITGDLKNLCELCAGKIVQDSNMTRYCISVIPVYLLGTLMKEALSGNRELSVKCLVENWKNETFVFHELHPNLFHSVQSIYDPSHRDGLMDVGQRYVSRIACTIYPLLFDSKHSHLRLVDLTGFSAAVTVKIDAFVTSKSMYAKLLQVLRWCSKPNSKLRLAIKRLSLVSLGLHRVCHFLEMVDPQFLTGLDLSYNGLHETDIIKMIPVLRRLAFLEAFDISCNYLTFSLNLTACKAFAAFLAGLKNLQWIDLGGCRIKTKLEQLLQNIPHALPYIRLSACALDLPDYCYLSDSLHDSHLVELNLSENHFHENLCYLHQILTACKDSLRVLELEDCALDDVWLCEMLPVLCELSNLMYLNVAENVFSRQCLRALMLAVNVLVDMNLFRVSYPSLLDNYEYCHEEEERAMVAGELHLIVEKRTCMHPRLRRINVVLC